jgi:hypothetical protein
MDIYKKRGHEKMTVHDFIVTYNETFKFIEDKYGVEAVKDLWKTISEEWCTHLDELIRTKGLEGMVEYWGGEGGTLGREKAEYEINLKDGVFSGIMHECPSVKELHERNRKVYNGKLTYCDHCPALYAPVAEKYGIKMTFGIEHDEDGECTGKCTWGASHYSL